MSGLRAIASELDLSIATVSRALRSDPAVTSETRSAVLRAASRLGYRRNAYVGEIMSSVRRASAGNFRGNIGLIWADSRAGQKKDRRLGQVRQGVLERADELGFHLSEFNLIGAGTKALARVLINRGIRGLVIAAPSFSSRRAYLHFDSAEFSSVCLGWGLLRPELDTVRFDYFLAVRVALHHARHAFGKDIAAIWNANTNLRAQRVAQASFLTHHPAGPGNAHRLFIDSNHLHPKRTIGLLKKRGVQCLVVESSVKVPRWLQDEIPSSRTILFRPPQDERVFGWIDTRNEVLGRWGIDLLAAKLARHEFGLPVNRQVVLVPPTWINGRASRIFPGDVTLTSPAA